MHYFIYEIKTGKIAQQCSTPNPEEVRAILKEGQDFLSCNGEGLTTHYVDNGRLIARPIQQTILEGSSITGLPVPCTIHINTASYECSDPDAELEMDQPGTYQIRVASWPYLDKEFEYEA